MDSLVAEILSFPPSSKVSDHEYDKQARALVQRLEGIATANLTGKSPDGQTLLELLNPSENSIACAIVLSAYVEALQSKAGQQLHKDLLPSGNLFPKIVLFLERFDPVQVRYVGSAFRDLLAVVVQAAEQSSQPWIAVPILRDVILRLDPTSSTLTSTHLDFVYLCLRLKLYRETLPILNLSLYNVPATRDQRPLGKQGLLCAQSSSASYLTPATGLTAKLTSRHFMQYFLYAAVIHIALRQWERAVLFLEIVLTVPSSHTASSLMVEAYKKFVLIGLLLKGKAPIVPRSANNQALKHIRALSRPYDVVAEAFNTHDLQRLQGDIDIGQREGIWQKDCNFGLIHEVLSAFRKFSVLRLSETFAALPLSEVARRISQSNAILETERYISNLILTGDLKAVISKDTNPPTLRFLPASSTTKTETQLQLDLDRQKTKLADLLELISSDDHRLEVSREYVEYLRKLKQAKDEDEKMNRQQAQQQQQQGAGGSASAAGGPDTVPSSRRSGGFGASGAMPGGFEDEDVMADA